jgi:phage terminase large subunit-like protein
MYRIHFYKSHHVHFCVFDDTMNLSRESYQYNIHLCLYLWYTNQPSHEIYSDVFSRPLPYTWFIVLLDSEVKKEKKIIFVFCFTLPMTDLPSHVSYMSQKRFL